MANRTSQGTVGVIVLANFAETARARAFAHLAFSRYLLPFTPGLTFVKVLGSGRDGGFGLAPSATHQGVFCAFRDDVAADAFLASRSHVLESYREHARELFTAKLRAYASRGLWSGRAPLEVTTHVDNGPIASLTRASIRVDRARAFWRHAPPSQDALRGVSGCLLSAGLGELPLLRQATFTVWESAQAMDAYARSGAHLAAIKAAYDGRYFSESLFARFVPSSMSGSWGGREFGP